MEIIDIVLYALVGVLFFALAFSLAVANYAGENLVTIYKEYDKVFASNKTPVDFAYDISDNEFESRINVKIIPGRLTDNYYRETISLSEGVANSNSISAYAVCAHELGHAIQYRDKPEKMRSFSRKLVFSALISKLTFPLFVAGVVFIFFDIMVAIALLASGMFVFFTGLLTKLSTIKIEKEASENALVLLQQYAFFDEEAIKQARKVLNAAKLTYVAQFLKSVLAWTLLVRKYEFY